MTSTARIGQIRGLYLPRRCTIIARIQGNAGCAALNLTPYPLSADKRVSREGSWRRGDQNSGGRGEQSSPLPPEKPPPSPALDVRVHGPLMQGEGYRVGVGDQPPSAFAA